MSGLPWFRMYAEAAGDPVLQSLSFDDQRHYFILLCLKCNGTVDRKISPTQRERIIVRGLGLDPLSGAEAKRRLMEVGLVDKNWQPNGWNKRQRVSDHSHERVRNYRNSNDVGNGSVTDRSDDIVTGESVSVSVSVSNSESSKGVDPNFEHAWSIYPRRAGGNPKRDAMKAWRSRIAAGVSAERMRQGVLDYGRYCESRGMIGTEYVMQAKRFFGPSEPYNDDWTPPTGGNDATRQRIDNSAPARVERAIAEKNRQRGAINGTAERVK